MSYLELVGRSAVNLSLELMIDSEVLLTAVLRGFIELLRYLWRSALVRVGCQMSGVTVKCRVLQECDTRVKRIDE